MEEFVNLFSIFGYYLYIFLEWVFSQNSSGIMTLTTALVAYYLYLQQKNNQKEDAAKTIYLEILDIERNIENIQPIDQKDLIDKILISNNHWNDNAHLFAKDFTQREMETINDLYTRAKTAQELLNRIQSMLDNSMDEKTRTIQRELVTEAKNSNGKQITYTKNVNKWLLIVENESYWFLPNTYKIRLKYLINLIPKITQTNIGIKFSRIAKIER